MGYGNDNAPGTETAIQRYCRDIAKRDEQARLDTKEIDTLKARVQDLEASYRGAKHDAEYFEKRVAELEVLLSEEQYISELRLQASKHISAQKAKLKEERDQLRARAEELEHSIKMITWGRESSMLDVREVMKARDELLDDLQKVGLRCQTAEARVAELEEGVLSENRFTQKFGNELQVVTKERDQLRESLRLANEGDSRLAKENNRLRAELEAYKVTVGTIGYGNYKGDGSELDEAQTSVWVVRQEYDKLRPKRAVTKLVYDFWDVSGMVVVEHTLIDGKIVSAEVIGEK